MTKHRTKDEIARDIARQKKRCNKCDRTLSFKEFSNSSKSCDGKTCYCKYCNAHDMFLRDIEYIVNHPDNYSIGIPDQEYLL